MKFPNKQYDIILADPPWSYRDKANSGKRGAEHKYPCMSLDDLKQLPVQDIAADNCVLFMWHVPVMPLEAIALVQAWGFRLVNMKAFTWHKLNRRALTSFMGMGNWTRANTEDCLIAVRGRPKRKSAAVRQVIESPIGRHSEKPAETRDRIVQLIGNVPRIELFARQRADGWDAWGNEL